VERTYVRYLGGMVGGPATAAEVASALEIVRDVCARLEPDVVPTQQVPELFDGFVALERCAGGAVLRMAARYEEAGEWKRNGAKSAEDDIARKTGTPTGKARRKLRTSKRLRGQSRTDEAVRRGRVSPEQADEVSDGAAASPQDEGELLDTAVNARLHTLREKAAASRAKADKDREERARRLHRQRSVRRWNDADGMANLLLRLPGDQMAEVDAALKPRIDKAFADARHEGRLEPVEAYTADVVRDLLVGPASEERGPGRRSQAVRPEKKVIARIDASALNRGTVEDGETCEIAGVGPVSVSAVRALLSDAFLAVVIRDGVDVLNVTHLGRQVTATQRTAMEARGAACEVCGGRHLLDIDHNEGWTLTHDTRVEDLSWLCWHCHEEKTRHNLRLEGPPNARWLVDRKTGERWHPRPGSDPPAPPDGDRAGPETTPTQPGLFTLAD
jgi:polyhydroxyalkanoate synthesis regulator phasin